MKVFILGQGFVADHLPYPVIKKRLPLAYDWIDSILSAYEPDVLINCIGKTGRPNIDWCELHKEETMNANVTLPLLLADYCKNNNVHLIQIGSGCIYFGESPHKNPYLTERHDNTVKPEDYNRYFYAAFELADSGWEETDFANPQSFYSKTKYSCDLMLGALPHVTTLRIRMPVSDKDVPRNLINKLRGYKQVIDIPNSMTFMSDLSRCVEWAAQNKSGGIYHVANPQPLTAARIMKEYQKYVPEHRFEIISEQQLDAITIAKRSNCILNTNKLRQAGFEMTDSEEALTVCMAKYAENMRRNNV
jgi:dTDP-4-dehydrorhamnose reductase